MDTGRLSLPLMTLRAMWRRKWGNFAIALMLLLGVCSSIILQQLTIRQESAKAQMIQTTDIRCVVTDANGMNAERLRMLSSFVDNLVGRDEDSQLPEYVDRVQALSVTPLVTPENYKLHRILNFASDEALSQLSGTEITLYDGWTEGAFLTDQAVCLIPKDIASGIGESLIVQQEGQEPMELTVMRCLGMSSAKVFSIVFEEFLVLALCGGTIGFLCGYLAEGSLSLKAILCALGIVCVYLVGAATATVRVYNVNVMKLMKGENEA